MASTMAVTVLKPSCICPRLRSRQGLPELFSSSAVCRMAFVHSRLLMLKWPGTVAVTGLFFQHFRCIYSA